MMKMLDCFCGYGGASEGFAREGFDCTGIEINLKAAKRYPYNVIVEDFLKLRGQDFKGYDVIWGSPPCRDFSPLGIVYGKTWKRPPDPKYGLRFVTAYIDFVEEARPHFWIMENVHNLKNHLKIKPKIECYLRHKKHAFWGNFPTFFMPKIVGNTISVRHRGGLYPHTLGDSWDRAKIPTPCSQAFAHACKEGLHKR